MSEICKSDSNTLNKKHYIFVAFFYCFIIIFVTDSNTKAPTDSNNNAQIKAQKQLQLEGHLESENLHQRRQFFSLCSAGGSILYSAHVCRIIRQKKSLNPILNTNDQNLLKFN